MNEQNIKRYGIYGVKGDYHKNLDSKWPYYALYLEKLEFVDNFLFKIKRNARILDIGSGEGNLVEKYYNQGYKIEGIDLNYSSKFVKRGNILDLPYKKDSFDVVLCLDTLQYLNFEQQEKALQEIKRILKIGGYIIFAIPNATHFAARVYYLIFGKLPKTDKKTIPIGDRSMKEYLNIIERKFKIVERKGVLPTNFIISSLLITKFPSRFIWLLKIIDFFPIKDWCFLQLMLCKK